MGPLTMRLASLWQASVRRLTVDCIVADVVLQIGHLMLQSADGVALHSGDDVVLQSADDVVLQRGDFEFMTVDAVVL